MLLLHSDAIDLSGLHRCEFHLVEIFFGRVANGSVMPFTSTRAGPFIRTTGQTVERGPIDTGPSLTNRRNDRVDNNSDWTSPDFVDTPQPIAEARSNASGLTSPT